MQKPIQTSLMSPLSPKPAQSDSVVSPDQSAKVIPANPKVNRAKAQSRHSGILFAHANGKLYFEFLKRISVPQNHLPHKGEVRYSEVMRPFSSYHVLSGSLHRTLNSSNSLNSLISSK